MAVGGAVYGFKEGVQKAKAVNQSARRVVRIREHSTDELKEAASSYGHSLTSGLGLFAGAGGVAVAALVVLTVGLVVALNGWIGAPWGYFVTVFGYLVIAGVFVGAGKRVREVQREDAQEHVDQVRDEIRYASRPVRDAFGSHDK